VVKGTAVKACAARFATVTATMGAGSFAVLGVLGINKSANHGAEFRGFRDGFSRGIFLDIDQHSIQVGNSLESREGIRAGNGRGRGESKAIDITGKTEFSDCLAKTRVGRMAEPGKCSQGELRHSIIRHEIHL
jgi:hypothetical protein